MRGIQIKKLLLSVNNTVLSDKTAVEKAELLLEFLNSKKTEVDSSITSATNIKSASKYSSTYFIDQLELQNEIEWSIKIIEFYIIQGSFNYDIVPISQLSIDDSTVIKEIAKYIVSILEKN